MIKIVYKNKSTLNETNRGISETKNFFKTNFPKIISFVEDSYFTFLELGDLSSPEKYREIMKKYEKKPFVFPAFFALPETKKSQKMIVEINYYLYNSGGIPLGFFKRGWRWESNQITLNIFQKDLEFVQVNGRYKLSGPSKNKLFKRLYETFVHEFVHSIQYDDKTTNNFYNSSNKSESERSFRDKVNFMNLLTNIQMDNRVKDSEDYKNIVNKIKNSNIIYTVKNDEIQAFTKEVLFLYKKSGKKEPFEKFLLFSVERIFGRSIDEIMKNTTHFRIVIEAIKKVWFDFYEKHLKYNYKVKTKKDI